MSATVRNVSQPAISNPLKSRMKHLVEREMERRQKRQKSIQADTEKLPESQIL